MGDTASPRPRPRCYRTELNQGHRGLTKSSLAPPISETIKWKAPTFMFRGNIASFYPRSTKHVSLMFHTGAVLPDRPDCWKAMGRSPAWRGSAMSLTLQLRLRRYADSSVRGSS